MRRSIRRTAIALTVLVGVGLLSSALMAQRGGRFRMPRGGAYANVPYDGKFVFARLRYRGYGGWSADYPVMERNLTSMMHMLTSVDPHTTGSNVHDLDDPELLKYPVAYLSEPGYWFPTDSEVRGLQEYLAKGGFLIVDDFHFANEWAVFEDAMRRVWPDAVIDRLEVTHPIFNTFFQIESLEVPYPGRLGEQGLMGEFYGIHEGNDPSKRLSVVINYNIDIGDYMEWSQTDSYAVAPTNEAYKFGINYIIYGLTR
jgi:hypothetical protein